MNAVIEFLFGRPAADPEPYWRNRIPAMRLEESMSKLERGIGQLGRRDFEPVCRDLDESRPVLQAPLQIPETLDLFADGLMIAQAVLDWEERAGQPIEPLIAHIRRSVELQKSVEAKANGGASASNPEQGTTT